MAEFEIGFIGTGNMGGALAGAVAKSVSGDKMIVADGNREKAMETARELNCSYGDNNEVAAKSHYIFLGVKPQVMADMLGGIAGTLSSRTDRFVLVTMAAGIKTQGFKEMLGEEYPIIRIMPNTPVSIGEGVVLYSPSSSVTDGEVAAFTEYMKNVGTIDRLDESLIDAACAISGCGPAFVYMFAEALADGAVECGLPRAKANEYAAQTLIGAAKLLKTSGKHSGTLKDEVCSPGGTTIAGVHALENAGFRGAVMDAVTEAFNKTKK